MELPTIEWFKLSEGILLTKSFELIHCIIDKRSGGTCLRYLMYSHEEGVFLSRHTNEDITYGVKYYALIK